MTSPPAPGTPYHRLARTARHRWWLPIVATLAFVGGYLFLLVLTACFAAALTEFVEIEVGPLAETALLLASLAVLIPFALLAAWLVQRRPAGTLHSVVGRLRWRWLGRCLLVAFGCTLLLIGVGMLIPAGDEDLEWVSLPTFLVSAAVLLALVPLQAAGEEYAFRGWLLQAVGAYVRAPWLPIAVQAVVFAALHGWGTAWGFGALVVTGAATGWLTVRTGGLEAGIALHVANNVVSFLLVAALGDLDSDETLADAPWQLAVLDAVSVCLFTAVILWLARRRPLDTVVPLPAPPDPHDQGVPHVALTT
ncbi:type II CAAX endopeptidase family protein [Actinomycetes bacterium KLBMP 9797]